MSDSFGTEGISAGKRFSRQWQTRWRLFALGLLVLGAGCWGDDTPSQPTTTTTTTTYVGQTREYWIQADDVLWDYAPSFPINLITGQPFDDDANVFVAPGPDRIGHRYFKALYREYTRDFAKSRVYSR